MKRFRCNYKDCKKEYASLSTWFFRHTAKEHNLGVPKVKRLYN